MKDYLFSNSNIECLVKINFKTIPSYIEEDADDYPERIKYFHS
jgi:hypothetical protein